MQGAGTELGGCALIAGITTTNITAIRTIAISLFNLLIIHVTAPSQK
jgi:hypothetical protein